MCIKILQQSGERFIKFQRKTMRHPTNREIEILKPPLIGDEYQYHSPMALLRMFLYEEKENDNAR